MSTPYVNGDQQGHPTGAAWGEDASEVTQVTQSPVVGDDLPTTVHQPSAAAEWPNSARSGSDVSVEPGRSEPLYSSPAVTSVYPQAAPGYAPTGYPAAYLPATAAASSQSAVTPAKPASRVGRGFLAALVGLILTAGGVWLAARFGIDAATDLGRGSVVIKHSLLATVGALLLFAAVALNGWSPWATVIPGLALTGIGGWALYDASAAGRVARWTKSVLPGNQLTAWHVSGFTLIVGLILLAASLAAVLARASGKRDGRLIERAQV